MLNYSVAELRIRNYPCEYDGVEKEANRACKVLWKHQTVME